MSLFRAALADVVGEPAADVLPRAGDRADDDADDSRTDGRRDERDELPQRGNDLSDSSLDLVGDFLLKHREEFRDPEDADESRDEGDSPLELKEPEREARVGEDLLHAHHRRREAEEAHDPPLEGVLPGRERAADHDAEQGEEEHFPVPEFEGDHIDERREEDHHEDAEHRPDERRDDSGSDRQAPLALFREREAVETCCGRRRRARDVDHDGRVEPSGDRADIDGEQERHGAVEFHAVGEVDEEREGHCRREAGDGPHDEAEKTASEDQCEDFGRERSEQGVSHLDRFVREKVKNFHGQPSFLTAWVSGTGR